MTQSALPSDAADLTHHIETRYHARHREQLPRLIALAERVESVHADDDAAPAGLSQMLRRIHGDMEIHMKKEEMILFPAIRRGGMPGIEHPIAVMRADHAGHDDDIADLRAVTGGPTLPENACNSWTTLYRELGEFIDDLTEHMRIENDILFPQFE